MLTCVNQSSEDEERIIKRTQQKKKNLRNRLHSKKKKKRRKNKQMKRFKWCMAGPGSLQRDKNQVRLSCLDHFSSQAAQGCPFPPQTNHQRRPHTSSARTETTPGREGTDTGGEETRRRRRKTAKKRRHKTRKSGDGSFRLFIFSDAG